LGSLHSRCVVDLHDPELSRSNFSRHRRLRVLLITAVTVPCVPAERERGKHYAWEVNQGQFGSGCLELKWLSTAAPVDAGGPVTRPAIPQGSVLSHMKNSGVIVGGYPQQTPYVAPPGAIQICRFRISGAPVTAVRLSSVTPFTVNRSTLIYMLTLQISTTAGQVCKLAGIGSESRLELPDPGGRSMQPAGSAKLLRIRAVVRVHVRGRRTRLPSRDSPPVLMVEGSRWQ
jgi:hypothetical protein